MRKYKFDWSLIGDIGQGRPNLGDKMDIDTYRLMLYTLRDVIEQAHGSEEAERLLFDAGKLAGKEFFKKYINPVSDLGEFVSKTQKILKEKKIGILRIEEAAIEQGKAVLTVDEDLDCSGLPEMEDEVCTYDEGFISGLFESFTEVEWKAEEIDCWCSGARTCRFEVKKI